MSEIAFEIDTVVEVFKPVVSVTELWMKTLENTTKDFGARVTQALADKYGFSNDEAVKFLGLESVSVNRKAMAKRSKSKEPKEPKEKAKKEKAPKVEKVRLPFTGACDATLCQAVAYNHGLFTQCEKKPLENHSYCVKCQAQADQNASGKPDCGNMEDRLASPMYDYKDSKGRSPVAYTKIMKKYGYTQEQVEAEFAKINGDVELNPVFFEEPEKKKGGGRPKKNTENVAESTDDLFNAMTANSGSEMGDETKKKAKLTEEEKAEKKAKLEAERAAKKAEREEKEAIEKAERAEKRKAELEAKKAEREAKKAEEKAEKEAKRAEEKAKKAQEKAEKEAEEKSKKEAEKEAKKIAKKSPVSPVVSKTETKTEEPKEDTKTEEAPKKKMSVVKVVIDGTTYYMNKETKIVYDPKTKEVVGTYDEENKKLIPVPEEEDEEVQEEEYESSESESE
jgi:hypothetical protein